MMSTRSLSDDKHNDPNDTKHVLSEHDCNDIFLGVFEMCRPVWNDCLVQTGTRTVHVRDIKIQA